MIRSSNGATESPWSPREAELLAVTLELLQEHGYDRLSLDAVATTARASKATLYRRWPTKAELVLAAFVEGTRHIAVDPDTGTLRSDLLALAEQISAHVSMVLLEVGVGVGEVGWGMRIVGTILWRLRVRGVEVGEGEVGEEVVEVVEEGEVLMLLEM